MTETIEQRIDGDYLEDLRWGYISQPYWNLYKPIVERVYRQQESGLLHEADAQLAITILDQVAIGSSEGLVKHGLQADLSLLAERLLSKPATLKIGTILCPDWGWHYEGETVVYDMDSLNGGLPKTAERIYPYIEKLAKRANTLGKPVEYNAYYPAWELTRNGYLPDINGGISSRQALVLLRQTIDVTRNYYKDLENSYFTTNIRAIHPEGFRDQVLAEVDRLLHHESDKVKGVAAARKDFYNGHVELSEIARDLAEAKKGFNTIARYNDILVIPSSPAIARACLSGGNIPWIQLSHGYKG